MYNKQVADFVELFKNRFTPIQHYMGMPGNVGYQAKINRQDVNATIQV